MRDAFVQLDEKEIATIPDAGFILRAGRSQ